MPQLQSPRDRKGFRVIFSMQTGFLGALYVHQKPQISVSESSQQGTISFDLLPSKSESSFHWDKSFNTYQILNNAYQALIGLIITMNLPT
jgi:hypothetical protein